MSDGELLIPIRDYDLAATVTSGQAFRWEQRNGGWEGVVAGRWVRLEQREEGILARAADAVAGWQWLKHYLQTDVDLDAVLRTFPQDDPMRASVKACRGLRLLRQDPWECLASFILSSTKQIVQIQQIVRLLCECFGSPVRVPHGHSPTHAFPTADQLATSSETQLRSCKMGFRAPNLLATARIVVSAEIDLTALAEKDCDTARAELIELPGVGEKIANCVLLFAYGFQEAFPVDVWVRKALLKLYFPKRRPSERRLLNFTKSYFGPYSGYAQQYLFHYMRMNSRKLKQERGIGAGV